MANEVITDLEQVTPAWLTEVLCRSDALTSGAVESFELGTDRGNWSTNARLRVRYSEVPGAPCRRGFS